MNSQACQDVFVFNVLKQKADGYFIDIGSQRPIIENNTYYLESIGWTGLCFDRDYYDYSNRTCKFFNCDVLSVDFTELFNKEKVPRIVDYLSIDIDENSLAAFELIPTTYTFKVITIEHDSYRLGLELKNKQKEVLHSLGYYLLCEDVTVGCLSPGQYFEDWWVHPKFIDIDEMEHIKSNKELCYTIVGKFTI